MKKQRTTIEDFGSNGNDKIKDKLAEIFADPNTQQLMMTSILGRGEIYLMAEGLTRQELYNPDRYVFDDETGLLTHHIPISKIHLENILRLKMSQGGKNREYLTYLAEQEMYDMDDDLNKQPFRRT